MCNLPSGVWGRKVTVKLASGSSQWRRDTGNHAMRRAAAGHSRDDLCGGRIRLSRMGSSSA